MDDIIIYQGRTDERNKRWISERWKGMSNRCRCAKMKVTLSINFDVYNIII